MRGLRSRLRARAHTGNRAITRTGLVVASAAVALAGLPGLAAPAAAAGNGLIGFTSGAEGSEGPPSLSALAVSPGGGASEPVSAASGDVIAAFPVYSPDGKRVVFTRGSFQSSLPLYFAKADGSGPVMITQTTAPPEGTRYLDIPAAFSPDGKKVAFTRQIVVEDEGGTESSSQAWLVDVATKTATRLAPNVQDPGFGFTGYSASGVFSADGKHVVVGPVQETGLGGGVYRAPVTGGNAQSIVVSGEEAYVGGPTFSPDGKRIAFGALRPGVSAGNCEVFTVPASATDVALGSATKLTTLDCTGSDNLPLPSYSPNGTLIAISTVASSASPDPDAVRQLRVIPATGGTATPLTALAEGLAAFPVWSPDSAQVAFAHMGAPDEGEPSGPPSSSLRVVRVADPTHAAGPPLATAEFLVPSSWQRLPDAAKPPVAGLHVCNEKAPVPAGYRLITGTRGNDRLAGTKGKDLMRGLAGNDVIVGKGGGDILCGNGGADRIRGGPGDDRIYGGSGADDLRGSRGADHIGGGKGADVLRGGRGSDVLTGNDGNDRLLGQQDADRLRGGRGTDTGVGGPGKDRFFGVENKTQ